MSTATAMIILIALGYFSTLVWYRDRVIHWKAIGFGLLGLLLVGLLNIATALTGIILGWIDLSAEIDIHVLGSSISYFLLLAVLVCLFQSMLPAGVLVHKLWPNHESGGSSETNESPPSE